MRIWLLLIRYCNEGEAFQELVDSCLMWIVAFPEDKESCNDIASGWELEELAAMYRTPLKETLRWLMNPTDKVLGRKHLAFLEQHANQIKRPWEPTGWDPNGEGPILLDFPCEMGSVISPVCKFIKDQIDLHDDRGIAWRKALPIAACKRTECDGLVLVRKVREGGAFCSLACKAKWRRKRNADYQKNYRKN